MVNTTKIFSDCEKSLRICFVKDNKTGLYIHTFDIVNPLRYGCVNHNFVLWSVRKAIKYFIGFLDYSKDIDFCVCDNIVGIRLSDGKVYTNNEGKIRFTLNY